MNYKIIFTDLDRTLLNNEMRLSEENRLAIQQYVDMGGVFVPNSGRSIGEIPDEVTELPEVRFVIGSNGADIYDKQTGEHIGAAMTREEVAKVFDILSEYEVFLGVHYHGDGYVDADRLDLEIMRYYNVDDYFGQYYLDTNLPHKEFDAFCRGMEEVEMVCAFFRSPEGQETCHTRLQEEGFMVASSHAHNIEIFSPSAGKGNAVRRLAAHLGIACEETVAMGDSKNDLSMLEAAGLGLAVANGSEITKANADAVICRNDEHIMPYVMKKYIR